MKLVNILRSPLLGAIAWLEHGFGTRLEPLSQEGMVSLKQIHSNLPCVADRTEGCAGEADALLTDQPGVAVSIRTADCYPILLADTKHRAVAAVHAGWRGTAEGVLAATIDRMGSEFGSRPEDIAAAIGPGIGACCYQVGEDVARRFGMNQAGKLNLCEENFQQLTRLGIPGKRITWILACTFCDAPRFFSWRRDHAAAGRMISYIKIKAL